MRYLLLFVLSVGHVIALRYSCMSVKVGSALCQTFRVSTCVPATMDRGTLIDGIGEELTMQSCTRISEYSCLKLQAKDINLNFCSGDDPGFCQANRLSMLSTCETDGDCNPYIPDNKRVIPKDVCCNVWERMQPCVLDQRDIEFAIASKECSNATDCKNPVTPADTGDSALHSIHCFFTTYLNFFFKQPCE